MSSAGSFATRGETVRETLEGGKSGCEFISVFVFDVSRDTGTLMKNLPYKLGYAGLILGSVALILALFHFWAGPFSPQPTLETVVADKVADIRDSTLKALKGEEYREVVASPWDADRITNLIVAIFGALAIILGIFAFIQKAPRRLAGSAAILGAGAIGFQMFTFYVAAFFDRHCDSRSAVRNRYRFFHSNPINENVRYQAYAEFNLF